MTEKRFAYVNLLEVEMIYDQETERGYYFNGENCTTNDVKDLIQLLNEQQFTISRLEEENEQLRRLFEEMKQPITVNLTEEDEKELRKLLGIDLE